MKTESGHYSINLSDDVCFACEQAFGRAGNQGEGKAKRPVDLKTCRQTFGTAVPRHQMAVHQILMQVLIGQNTDC